MANYNVEPKKIFLCGKNGNGLYALVDRDDFSRVNSYKWFLAKDGYALASIYRDGKRTTCRMHRFILYNPPKNILIDHINFNPLDNRKDNLRKCSHLENSIHRRTPKTNTSGYRGIWWDKNWKKWRVGIRINGKRKYLGAYLDKIKAAKIYDNAARKYFGDFSVTNF